MKKLLGMTAGVTLFLVLVVPTVTGWQTRSRLASALDGLPDSDGFSLQVRDVRGGWLNSTIDLTLEGDPFWGGGTGIPLQLLISHGPLIWHLPDTPLAITHIQLGTPPVYTGPGAGHYSGSALLRLDTGGQLLVNGLLGFAAFDGDHLLQFNGRWPATATLSGWRNLLRQAEANLALELDAEALLQSPAADALRAYQQQGWLRFSNGRALSYLSLRNQRVDLNGRETPLANLIGNP